MERIEISARWFDGTNGAPHAATLLVDNVDLVVCAAAQQRRYPLAALRLGDRFPGVPLAVGLPDGGSLWVEVDAAGLDALARTGLVAWVAARAWAVALCVVLLVGAILCLDRYAIGWIANQVLHVVPESLDRRLGEKVLEGADAVWLARSRLSSPRRTALTEKFEGAAERSAPGVNVNLVFRRMPKGAGFNAFALPGGTIVLLDGLAQELDDDELLLVLGHEVGHVVHRDGMHAVVRSFGLAALASTVWGDFSTWAATFGATVQAQAHSRDAERAADTFMREFARRNSISADAEVRLWNHLRELEEESGGDPIPDWLSTHPDTEERIRSARGTAGTAAPGR